jgi:hypothetical protein
MYLYILNDYMVGFSNITAHKILDYLFMYHGNITAVDLENKFVNTSGKSGAQIPQLPLGDDSSPWGR